MVISYKGKHSCTTCPSNSAPRYLPKVLHTNVPGTLDYNCRKLGPNQMSINRWTDLLAHPHKVIPLSMWKEWIAHTQQYGWTVNALFCTKEVRHKSVIPFTQGRKNWSVVTEGQSVAALGWGWRVGIDWKGAPGNLPQWWKFSISWSGSSFTSVHTFQTHQNVHFIYVYCIACKIILS